MALVTTTSLNEPAPILCQCGALAMYGFLLGGKAVHLIDGGCLGPNEAIFYMQMGIDRQVVPAPGPVLGHDPLDRDRTREVGIHAPKYQGPTAKRIQAMMAAGWNQTLTKVHASGRQDPPLELSDEWIAAKVRAEEHRESAARSARLGGSSGPDEVAMPPLPGEEEIEPMAAYSRLGRKGKSAAGVG